MRNPFAHPQGSLPILGRLVFLALTLAITLPLHADNTNLTEEVRLLREENALLQQQVKQQGAQLDTLIQKVSSLETTRQIEGGNDKPLPNHDFGLGQLHIGVEGGVGFAETGPDGFAPGGQFRVDEARLFLEAPVYNDVYFYGELLLATQENPGGSVQLGELYLDFENISKLWQQDDQLNARLGQLNTPFGEEYLTRTAIENPLITHSIVDFWATTPGAELYGNFGKFSYVVAVQNGGENVGGDKMVAGRIGFDPDEHWHFSVSGMRTGNLEANADSTSQMWFANGFFRSIGSPATTQFHVNAVEGDATARWQRWHGGHVSAFGGVARYDDNDPTANNARNIYYYSGEVMQNLPKKFYAVTRFSQALCTDGIPMVGYGNFGDYFFGPLTTELWRLSLGLGYRFSDRLVLKMEYSFERGTEVGGDSRNKEDFFGTEAAFKF